MDSPFIKAMQGALANRLAATTELEKREAEDFIAGILRAARNGEDVTQFIPTVAPEPFDARMASAGKDSD